MCTVHVLGHWGAGGWGDEVGWVCAAVYFRLHSGHYGDAVRTHDAPRVYGGDEETRAVSHDVLLGSSLVPCMVLSFCGEGHMCMDWV